MNYGHTNIAATDTPASSRAALSHSGLRFLQWPHHGAINWTRCDGRAAKHVHEQNHLYKPDVLALQHFAFKVGGCQCNRSTESSRVGFSATGRLLLLWFFGRRWAVARFGFSADTRSQKVFDGFFTKTVIPRIRMDFKCWNGTRVGPTCWAPHSSIAPLVRSPW